ncbi:MAG: thioredoxin [Sphingobacteriales bacterium]|jgi:thioredoxin 1|nr:thioredoxin [Sphingobacteriales bacterium]MBK8473811.1 thioredoxin [Sphingobacteriales bacterium]
MALKITDANFQAEVLDSGKVAVVDFWAEWCGPCLAVAPIIEELAKDYAGKAVIGKVDVDNNQDISMRYGIRNIPTILFIKNGQVADKQVGLAPRNVLEAKLKALL